MKLLGNSASTHPGSLPTDTSVIPTFFEAAVQNAAACYKAGQASNLEFVILVQDYASQLWSMDNETDDLTCKERIRLIKELYERSSALIKAAERKA